MFRRWFMWCLALVVLGGGFVTACTDDQSSGKGRLALPQVASNIKDQGEFPITVDYTQSLAEMIAAGRYDWISPDITAEHFPVQGSGVVNTTVRLVHFNEWVNAEKALRRLDEQGLRSATLPELLAFGAKYTDKQKEFFIIALGSRWQESDGDRGVAYLGGFGDRRDLRLVWLPRDFCPCYRFLVSSK